MTEIIAGIQTADGFEAKHKVDLLEGKVSWFHIDVSDGVFVPSQTIWATDIRLIRPRVPYHLHLMANINEQVIDDFLTTDADCLFFYPKAAKDPKFIISLFSDFGKKAGLVVDLDESTEVVNPYLQDIQYVLVMTVKSGFAGQQFHPEALTKINELKNLKRDINVGVDGGIKVGTASDAARAGADFVVANSAIWEEDDLDEAIEKLRQDVTI